MPTLVQKKLTIGSLCQLVHSGGGGGEFLFCSHRMLVSTFLFSRPSGVSCFPSFRCHPRTTMPPRQHVRSVYYILAALSVLLVSSGRSCGAGTVFDATSDACVPDRRGASTAASNASKDRPPVTGVVAPVAGVGATGTLFSGATARRFEGRREFATWTPRVVEEPPEPIGSTCPHWSVVTTINNVTEAVRRAAALNSHTSAITRSAGHRGGASSSSKWCIVVVGDKQGPVSYPIAAGAPHIVFLSAAQQQKIFADSRVAKATPWNHFGRKNIGFLYAIQHGALMIFDFDDDNILNCDGNRPVSPLPSRETRWCSPSHAFRTFNPYSALGTSVKGTWPRGLPLTDYKGGATRACNTITAPHRAEIAVFQSAANGDPDVDAIYRLTRELPFSYAPNAPAVLLPKWVLTPYNAQATVHTAGALWGVLLPITVPGRVSDIWRGYAAQRLFWDLDLSVAYTPAKVFQDRNVHNYLADLQSEQDLYLKAGTLVDFLREWTCPAERPSVPACMETLWIELYERDYLQEADVQLVQAWLAELIQIPSFAFPEYPLSFKR